MQSQSNEQQTRTRCPACASGQLTAQFDRQSWSRQFEHTADVRETFADMMSADPRLAFDKMLICDKCGTLFPDRVPPIEALSDFYTSHYGDTVHVGKMAKKLALEKRRIFLLKWLTSGRRFLDVGCNIGCAVEAARWNGFTATGIELNPEAVKIARQNFPNNQFLQSTIDELTETQAFDMVYCTEVVEHVPDTNKFIESLARALLPRGILFLSTPDAGHFSVRRHLFTWEAVKPPEHLTLFTKTGLRHALRPYFKASWFFPNQKPGIQLIARR
jgi:2-polyprenyl-3-methyl-5-hydroxy-6-metoxy-1,4-benzoquinol methylase